MANDVELSKIQELLAFKGAHGAKFLSVLGKQQQFISALKTPIGYELLKDMMKRQDEILEKIIGEVATPQEVGEYRVLRDLTTIWGNRVAAYLENLKKLNQG